MARETYGTRTRRLNTRAPLLSLLLAGILTVGLSGSPVAAERSPLAHHQEEAVLTIDHYVPHISSTPAMAGQPVQLYVRERVLAEGGQTFPGNGRVALFVHGATYPSVHGFDVPLKDYSWMAYLARAGFDVFAMDMTGYGWSTRPPQMDEPCNANPEQQQLLMPAPLAEPCSATFPFRATHNPSQWDDVDAVVDYIRTLRGVDQVSLIGWSGGGPRFGGYTAVHPEKVDVLILLAPAYSRSNPTEPPPEIPEPGFPMNIGTQLGRDGGMVSAREAACGNAYDSEMNEVVRAINAQFDPVGANWGSGVVRAPTTSPWGWSPQTAAMVQAPTLLLSGEFDDTVAPQTVRDLYEDLGTQNKVFLDLACTGHRAQHQVLSYRIVQDASLDWLLNRSIGGMQQGSLRFGD